MAVHVPQGFRLAGVACGLKRDPSTRDLVLVVCDGPAAAAGVYTQNLVHAAPVALDRSRTPSNRIRAVVINSGNANACTGEKGIEDAREMARLAAAACGAAEDQALVLSTGIIGAYMPMEKIAKGIREAATRLAADDQSLEMAASGMMTTDTVPKLAGRTVSLRGKRVQITGMAKGAAMIAPNMATMLCLIMTDAKLTPEAAQAALSAATEDSFNCLTIDGHMSTNDTVLLLASGAGGGEPLVGNDLAAFQTALQEVCIDLARAMANDGEGASHRITIEVAGCANRDAASRIAKAVAESPLVKTAIHGADPNWGRIVSAAGYAGVPFNPNKITLHVNGLLLYENGEPVAFDGKAVSDSIRSQRDTLVELRFQEGDGQVRFWTSDLTAEYVRLNADYHT